MASLPPHVTSLSSFQATDKMASSADDNWSSLSCWEPLPDPHRPEFPYCSGLGLSIRRHTPPTPFGPCYYKGAERQEAFRSHMAEFSQSEWCLQCPPADPWPHADQTVHHLRVIDQLACRDGRGAQVLRCHLDQDESRVYVAKIYDALYYSFCIGYTPFDVTFLADMDYSREAAAYEDLHDAGDDGLYAPKYYGSWTFDMTLLDRAQTPRPVRMVLMEWVPGVSLQSLIDSGEAYHIPPEQRLDILAAALELDTKVAFSGIRHRDFAPRNVIWVPSDADKHSPLVRLVDFNISVAMGRPNSKYRKPRSKLPISPMYIHWRATLNEFTYWTPEPHRSRLAAFRGWLKARWEHSAEFTLHAEWMDPDRVNFDVPIETVQPFPDVIKAACYLDI